MTLLKALEEITKVKYGLETNLPSDLMVDIKALYHLERLQVRLQMMNCGNIFANFCIGK
jgi:tRNA modification GTPase